MSSIPELGAGLVQDAAWQALTLAAVAVSPGVGAWDCARGRGLAPLAQRLGVAPRAAGAAWFAAASAGEVAAGLPLLRLVAGEAVAPLALSVMTRHGRRAAERHSALLAAPPFHPPLDAWPCVQLALARLRPRALVTIETEIWPNLFRACARARVPVAVVNARLSPRALRRYRRVRSLLRRALAGVRLVAARTEADAAAWLELGAPPAAVVVTGNMKFDAALAVAREPDLPWAQAAGLTRGPWLAFGSTAEGEEEPLLAAFESLRAGRPDLRLLLAPKRPDRWDEVARLVASRGLTVVRRTALGLASPPPPVPDGGVLLLDSTGELARGYRHAQVAFVGGSLVPHGGQNLLEPAASGVPVVFGPHVANFRDAADALLADGGGIQAEAGGVAGCLARLVTDDAWRTRTARAAEAAVRRHEGATRRTLDLLRPLLDPTAEGSSR